MDLYKAFDILDCFLLITKFEVYGFETESRDIRSKTVLVYGEQLHHPCITCTLTF